MDLTALEDEKARYLREELEDCLRVPQFDQVCYCTGLEPPDEWLSLLKEELVLKVKADFDDFPEDLGDVELPQPAWQVDESWIQSKDLSRWSRTWTVAVRSEDSEWAGFLTIVRLTT